MCQRGSAKAGGSEKLVDTEARLSCRVIHQDGATAKVTAAMRAHFRPDFLNRVDDIVFFNSLRKEDLAKIVDIQMARFAKRLEARQLTLAVTDAARARIAEAGYDPEFGARPLKRTLQRLIQDPLAMALLKGDIPDGASLKADAAEDDGLSFSVV